MCIPCTYRTANRSRLKVIMYYKNKSCNNFPVYIYSDDMYFGDDTWIFKRFALREYFVTI